MKMKKIYILSLIAVFAIVVSCVDKSLDPLQFDKVKKGTILALRGTQLDNIYNKGIAGAEVFPKIATGTEIFAFDGEYLSENPKSLESVDVYAIDANRNRVLLKNVPASDFKDDGTYKHPWVSISFDFAFVLSKLGINATFNGPNNTLDATVAKMILDTYKFGIDIECDLNLTNGTQVLAADIVASGLFQSNQFYPAQRLNWAMTDYCSYNEADWAGQWYGDEVGTGVGSPPGGDNLGSFVKVAANTWRMDNFFGDGAGVYAVIVFTPSTNPSTQIVKYLNDAGKSYQLTSEGGQVSGSGTYNTCTNTFTINTKYVIGGGTYTWIYNFHR